MKLHKKKGIKMVLLVISIVLTIGGIAAMLFVPMPLVRYTAATVSLAGVCLLYYYWSQMYLRLRQSKRSMEEESSRHLAGMERNLQNANKERDALAARIAKMKSAPALPPDMPLEARVAKLREHFSEDIAGKEHANYRRMFAELTEAASVMSNVKAIGKHTVVNLREMTKEVTLPLDEATRTAVECSLMRLALAAYDISTGYTTTDSSQSLATRLAAGDETSLQKATLANDNVYETPKVIRTLKNITEKYGGEKFIVNDYLI